VREGGIWVVPALGGSPRRLSPFGNAPVWSLDGNRLVFQDKPFNSVSGVDLSCGAVVSGIWVVAATGGSSTQISLPKDPEVCQNTDPSWTPDGRIVFSRHTNRFSQICAIARDGSGLRVLAEVSGTAITPQWLPHRDSIFFSNFSADGDFTIRRLPVDSNGKQTGSAEEVVGHSVGVPRSLAVSRDGMRLAFTASLPISQIDSIPLKASGIEPSGPPTAVTRENIYRYTLPFVSPAGRHIAFTLWRKGSNGDIWVSDIDGGNARLLSMTPNNSFCAGWLPNSSGVVYVKYSPAGSELWSVSLRDGVDRRLSPARPDTAFPSISPDGRYFVYHRQSDSGSQTLRKLDLATGRSSDLLAAKDVSNGFGIWSPDGKQVAFEIHLGEDDHLGTVSAAGGPYAEWTTGHGKTWPGSWSADGNTIIAAGRRDAVWNVRAIGRDHSEKKLTDYTSLRAFVRFTRLSPAGDRIIYEYNETKGNIYIGELVR
jgi:Tol biopolymer transport system component